MRGNSKCFQMDRFSAHMDRAWQLISKGDGVKALMAARQALSIDADSPEVHNLLGCIYAMDGDFDEALLCYERAMDLDDAYIDPLLNSAELLIHAHDRTDEAIDLCRRARELMGPEDDILEVKLLEIDALLAVGRAEEARELLDGIALSKSMGSVHAMLVGRALFETGDFEKSRNFIDYALMKDPLSADAWYCRGLLYREEGRRIDAVAAFKTVLESDTRREDVPWLGQLKPYESLMKKAIAILDDDAREVLASAKIVVKPLPTTSQLLQEVDPRQAVWIEGIDLENRSFKCIWFFYRNLEHIGILPTEPEETLAQVISEEVRYARRPF